MEKIKKINDPIYGFITIKSDLLFKIVNHPFFQRLRRIRQLGLSEFVYPGATHTRFHHALGATHLMGMALDQLKEKGIDISDQEYESAQIAILLHDIGHGPFSHALEFSLLQNITHENISLQFMKMLNIQFSNKLDLAISMFKNTYSRKFFHQLISSQLDVDRLDYLNRDSFYTGVSEGNISVDRIISHLMVVDDQIVVEEKAIYSIENFLNARRLMYWQVYLHKTALSAERMLINLMARAKEVHSLNDVSKALKYFLENNFNLDDIQDKPEIIAHFSLLDDVDIWHAIKTWSTNKDKVLSQLSGRLLNRDLFKIKLSNEPLAKSDIKAFKLAIVQEHHLLNKEASYFLSHGEVTNSAYILGGKSINILTKKGNVIDIAQAADLPNIKAMSKIVKKYYLCLPKTVSL
ncbi:HD domain-containing protein [Marivirga sp. S37H4]|uniref:HD domain-containing protein n=1 Tax=Marivirga aurantiaca TaxID=2802615 RepID=A0A934WW14_9BACT|nr:HD domain-containing protein [Marivirga aurantiaca]MBK6263885.1 HD domain-containing protein [Marivirga aurantiaca]